jgi:hypothetical protein
MELVPGRHPSAKNTLIMNLLKFVALSGLLTGSAMMGLLAPGSETIRPGKKLRDFPKGCVFRTVMGEEKSIGMASYKTPERVLTSLDRGLTWMMKAQQKNGGWGAGSHNRQDILDAQAVDTDPATTAMVGMALLRTGSTIHTGPHKKQLQLALEYLLGEVERSPLQSLNITELVGTQIQVKLGQNIDVILTSQFLSNIRESTKNDQQLTTRIRKANQVCINKIQRAQSKDGSIAGAGWAGVLQSSFAVSALEAAQVNDLVVDEQSLEKAKNFQKNNYDPGTGNVDTSTGAGVVLYSVSGSSRASAREARRVREAMDTAIREGNLPKGAPVTAENLAKIGFEGEEALDYATSYQVYDAAKSQAQRADVMSGYGNNGGEEFLSFLQTGEGLAIGKDDSWAKWYDDISGRLLTIQNNDGSWNGHHCITSPVFCTATCLLILSINNDIEKLASIGLGR